MGTEERSARSRRATSKPSMSGIMTSSTMRLGRKALALVERLAAVARHVRVEAFVPQGHGHELGDAGLIVHDQDARALLLRLLHGELLVPVADDGILGTIAVKMLLSR